MIITKEHQEAMVEKYIKQHKNQDQVEGFIDGMNEMMELVNIKLIEENKLVTK